MMESDASRRIARFAAFEYDTGTGELRKHGLRIKLQGQPVEVLAMLIEHSGEVVTREELQKRLWPADTYVDFEHSLNAAVKRLRAALGDSADAPRFVETLARQGYRFIAPVSYSLSSPLKSAANARAESLTRELNETSAGNSQVPRRRLGVPAFLTRWAFVLPLTGLAALAIGASLWLEMREDHLWQNPIARGQFQTVTNFEGVEEGAAVSRDGKFVAFLSDRDGQMDVWVTQAGSGQFHNLTRGDASGLVNPLIRTPAFSPDGSLVAYWARGPGGVINTWAVPTLGGQPRLYLEGVAEFDWSHDGSRLVYHTPGPGDPLFVSDGNLRRKDRPIFAAPAGLHSHFPLWAPDSSFIYFVHGSVPDKLDIWRIKPTGGRPERITSHNARVSHPVLLDQRTLLYLASDPDGSGPWLYGMDVERRIPHRLTSGLDSYTSLAAGADGRRLVLTLASPKRTLWRLHIADSPVTPPGAAEIPLTTSAGFSPRLGPNYLLYVSATGMNESIWKLADGTGTEIWSGQGARVFGGPAISPDSRQIAFSVQQHGRKLLYAMQSDGSNTRIVTDSLDLEGDPTWTPDGASITAAIEDHGTPHLYRIPVDGRPPIAFVQEYSLDPAWSPDGRFAVYSGPDTGTRFPVKAVTAGAAAYGLPPLKLTRGARHLVVLRGGRALVFMRGEIQHKNLWFIDLGTGGQRQLTNLPPDFDIDDFDISPDGREVVLERVRQRSDVVMVDLPRP